MAGERLLVVDDDENLRSMLSAALKHRDYDVESVDNGDAAIEAVAATRPDLLVLDVMLPGAGGFELWVRRSSRCSRPIREDAVRPHDGRSRCRTAWRARGRRGGVRADRRPHGGSICDGARRGRTRPRPRGSREESG
ncbi:response regulator [Ilumatobacter sp.]|uniref:response regulator n=1 Tax=Ilumatobacter sp. TaxID=1967498 RepID=UPI003AF97E4C